ncbi:MAG: hypothetical protein AAFY22_02140, partial [Pseudomonadota bacterium]
MRFSSMHGRRAAKQATALARTDCGAPMRLTFFAALLSLGAALFMTTAFGEAGAQTTQGGAEASEASPAEPTTDPQTTPSQTADNPLAGPATNGVLVSLNGPVTPPAADYLVREIEDANKAGADLIIIEIDTPGGLVDSMKTIIKGILASKTPVATYVSPQGARSASAGLYIMYAAHVSAMAPSTNTGAATPVEVGGGGPSRENPFEESPFEDGAPEDGADEETTEEAGEQAAEGAGEDNAAGDRAGEDRAAGNDGAAGDAREPGARDNAEDTPRETPPVSSPDALRAKIINDSVAYIRALAEERGRNADWAERAVREGVSVTHNEALALGVIDLIADDLDDLLQQIDGRTVATVAG